MRTVIILYATILGLLWSGSVLAQDGKWNITNASVGDFTAWAAEIGVVPLTGDFDKDGRDDIALLRKSSEWNTMPVAFARGEGIWSITNLSAPDFPAMASQSEVMPLTGDFDADGRDDIALLRKSSEWNTIPIAFARGGGTWSITNLSAANFPAMASQSEVMPLTGDFDADGRDDIALLRKSSEWNTIPIAFARGGGTWSITNLSAANFPAMASQSEVMPLTGDFDADGRDDIALLRKSSEWNTIPIAFARGSGTWSITNLSAANFPAMASASGVVPLTGDFDADGRDDIALLRKSSEWNTIPIAFARGGGTWSITNLSAANFPAMASASGVVPLTGDFNKDRRDDIVLLRQTGGWASVPIAFAQGNGRWNTTNSGVGAFAAWAATGGVVPLTGDFDADGRHDIALLRKSKDWNTLPIAFATNMGCDPTRVRQVPPMGVATNTVILRATYKYSVPSCASCPAGSETEPRPFDCMCWLSTIPELKAVNLDRTIRYDIRYAVLNNVGPARTQNLIVAFAGQNFVNLGGPGNLTGQPDKWIDGCDERNCKSGAFNARSLTSRLLSADAMGTPNSHAVVFLDHRYDWGRWWDENEKIANGITRYLKTLISPSVVKNIVIAGHSRGGCLTLTVARKLRADPTLSDVRLIVLPFDAVCDPGRPNEENWPSEATKDDNPLSSDNKWFAWRSSYPTSSELGQNTCAATVVGGEEFFCFPGICPHALSFGPGPTRSLYHFNNWWSPYKHVPMGTEYVDGPIADGIGSFYYFVKNNMVRPGS